MKCFNHRELDAIAVCKHCGRALCGSCLAEVGALLSCKGRCEAALVVSGSDNELRRRNLLLQGSIWTAISVLCVGLGLAFGGYGVFALTQRSQPWEVLLLGFVTAAFFLFMGVKSHEYARALKH